MTPGFISDVSKVCNFVSAADLMMIIMTMMMTKNTIKAGGSTARAQNVDWMDGWMDG